MLGVLLRAIILLIFTVPAVLAQMPANPTATTPSATDPHILTFNNPHISWLPSSRPRNQLLLFLQGTSGVPRAQFLFLETAAALGYHVIELAYPNDIAAQQACINSPDPDAYLKFRLEIMGSVSGQKWTNLLEQNMCCRTIAGWRTRICHFQISRSSQSDYDRFSQRL
jgi:hypothetical protein